MKKEKLLSAVDDLYDSLITIGEATGVDPQTLAGEIAEVIEINSKLFKNREDANTIIDELRNYV